MKRFPVREERELYNRNLYEKQPRGTFRRPHAPPSSLGSRMATSSPAVTLGMKGRRGRVAARRSPGRGAGGVPAGGKRPQHPTACRSRLPRASLAFLGPWASPCRLRVGSSGHFLFPGCAGLSLVREGPSWGAPCPRAVGLSLPVCPRCRRESHYHSPQVRVNDTTEQ